MQLLNFKSEIYVKYWFTIESFIKNIDKKTKPIPERFEPRISELSGTWANYYTTVNVSPNQRIWHEITFLLALINKYYNRVTLKIKDENSISSHRTWNILSHFYLYLFMQKLWKFVYQTSVSIKVFRSELIWLLLADWFISRCQIGIFLWSLTIN